jgi:5'-nucleotidase
MRILVTNDDGYASEGITHVAKALAQIGTVTVVAPREDNSGIAHKITIDIPVRVWPIADRSVTTYACTGTPADCVVVGAFDLAGGKPDLVVSGINRGANMGDDLNYSGTVAAAIEGVIIGIPALAISLAARWPQQDKVHHWDTAARVAVELAKQIAGEPLPPLTLLNVNVPNIPYDELRGIRWTRQGRKAYRDRVERRSDPRGGIYYWLWGSFDPATIRDGTDLAAVRDDYVSVTPISIDRTDEPTLEHRIEEAHVR